MFTAWVTVTLLAVAANTFTATGDLFRYRFVLANAAKVGVPESWLTPLGIIKSAGVAGLLLGLAGVPVVGTLAAAGFIVFFIGAIATHLRAGDYALTFPAGYLLLAVATLALDLAV